MPKRARGKPAIRASLGLIGVIVAVGLGFATPVWAAPIVWVLNGVTFVSEGTAAGTANGSFTWDADTMTFGTYNIMTSASGSFSAQTYSSGIAGDSGGLGSCSTVVPPAGLFQAFFLNKSTSFPFLILTPTAELSDAGGTVPLHHACSFEQSQAPTGALITRNVSGGSVVAESSVAVPEPSSLVLMASAMLGLVWFRRRSLTA